MKVLLTGPWQRQSVWQWAHFESVCVCARARVLNSRSNLHLLHWFTPTPPPHLTSWQNDSPLWPIETQHTASAWPAEVAINPPAGLVAQLPQWDKTQISYPPVHTLFSHPPPLGPFFQPCFSELLEWIHQLSLQRRAKQQATKLQRRRHHIKFGIKSNKVSAILKQSGFFSNPTNLLLNYCITYA